MTILICLLKPLIVDSLEPPHGGGSPHGGCSNEYPQSMFWNKNKKSRYTPIKLPQFYCINVGYKGVYITQTCFPDDKQTKKLLCFSHSMTERPVSEKCVDRFISFSNFELNLTT